MQEKNLKMIRKLGIIIISITMLTSLAPFGYFEPIYADHSSKLIKMQREYPADAGFIDIALPMRINDLSNTIVFLSFSTPETADQSDTSRRWELIDDRTLRIFGEVNTPTGNNAGNLIIYILEMRSDEFDIETQNLKLTTTASEAPNKKSITLPSIINASRAFVLYNGLSQNASDTSWGSEEFGVVSLNNTHIDWEITTVPDTGTNTYGFSVVHANVTGILAQRGTGILDGTVGEVTDTITPPVAVDRDHTIVLITGRIDGGAIENADPDEVMVQVTINPSNDIVIHRDDDAPLDFIYEWQTMSFPPSFINVTHGEISMTDGEFIITDTITPVLDMDNSFVISGAGSPFGYGTGACDSGTAGAMDRCMNRLILTNMDTVEATREDDTGTNIVNYQVIQILETEVAEEPQGTNTLKQIVKISGTVPSAIEHDVTISPELTNVNKTMVFLTFESDGTGGGDPAGGRKSYEILNSTTLRIFGNADPSITNPAVNFTATLIEFDSSSPIVVQNEFFNYPQGFTDAEKTIHMSPINQSGSTIISLGRHLSGDDGSVGSEEIDRIRILTSNTWGYDTDTFQGFAGADGSTVVRADLVDYNDNKIFSQRGQLSMATATASVTPPIAIVQNQTMLLFSHTTSDGDLTASPDTSSVHATIDSTGDIDFFRPTATGTLEINWELISFPDTLLSIEHGIHHQDIGTTNATSPITPVLHLESSFAIGTEGMFGHGTGSGDNAVDATSSFLDIISTVNLEDNSTVRIVRGTSVGDFDIGFQVLSLGLTINQTATDTTTNLDETNFLINKSAVDVTVTVDTGLGFNITKEFSDIVVNLDSVNAFKIVQLIINDITTTLENVALIITKTLTDVVVNIDEVSTINDRLLNDTTTNSDEVNLFIILKPVIPSGGGSPASGGTPAEPLGIPNSPVRLIGLNVASLDFIVEQSDIVPSNFEISWFGDDSTDVKLTSIKATDDFIGFNEWFAFSPTPDKLEVDIEEGFDNRLPTDPRSLFNTALDDYVLEIPKNKCTGELVGVSTSNCFNPIIYEVPLLFEFEVKGATFSIVHTVTIDGRDRASCEVLGFELGQGACDFYDFLLANWWWIILAFLVLFIIPKIRHRRKFRVAHFIPRRGDDRDLVGTDTAKRLKRLKKVR